MLDSASRHLETIEAAVLAAALCSAVISQKFYRVPSIAASGRGHVALSASVASTKDYAGVAVAWGMSGDITRMLPSSVDAAQSGLASYDHSVGIAFSCLGDYSQMAVDPTDDMTLKMFQEYTTNVSNSWAVRWLQLKAPPPANIGSITSPSTLSQGLASTNVIVAGTVVSNSGLNPVRTRICQSNSGGRERQSGCQ